MASLSLSSQFEIDAVSNGKVTELLLQLKSAKAHGKNSVKVTPLLFRHLLRNHLSSIKIFSRNFSRASPFYRQFVFSCYVRVCLMKTKAEECDLELLCLIVR